VKQKEKAYLCAELERLNANMQKAETDYAALVEKVHPSNKKNALNLLYYLSLRSYDIRALQDQLHAFGLSALASSESHIRGQLLTILQRLGKQVKIPGHVFTYQSSKSFAQQKAAGLLGQKEHASIPYLMVTLDTQHATDYEAVLQLVQSGMNVARINCAHDDEKTWVAMVELVKKAAEESGRTCRIHVDLAGPKIRTVVGGKEKMKVLDGDTIYLCDENSEAIHHKNTIGCTLPGIARLVKAGEKVLFDDGLIEAKVESIHKQLVELKITRISSKKPIIKHEKGINLPDSNLLIPSLTEYDKNCLPFVMQYADMVGYSFVRTANDVAALRSEMKNDRKIALIIKIETPDAVKNLPDLLLTGLADEFTGIMIARGDLAVEIGFERMSEVQEEILWICEAAHVPVIWATQVLENMHKLGVATRSEITDAAYAAHADCVMINKGAYTIQVIETLKDILLRSGGHHLKKRYTFRPLRIASRFMNLKG